MANACFRVRLMATVELSAKARWTSPYHRFCQANRPLLPTHLKNADREKLLGTLWKSLSNEGRAVFTAGLRAPARSGQRGNPAWTPIVPGEEEPPPPAILEVARRNRTPRMKKGPGHRASQHERPAKWTAGEWCSSQAERWARAKQAAQSAPKVHLPQVPAIMKRREVAMAPAGVLLDA